MRGKEESFGAERRQWRRRISVANLAILTLFCMMLLPVTAQAGGIYLSEFGTVSLGTASAGGPAGTDDASTALHNPAAMTRLDDHQFSTGLAPAYAIVEFDADRDTPLSGSNGGNQGGFSPIVSSQYVHKLSDRWRLGLSLLSFSGSILDPSDGWVGRHQITQSSLLTITLLPTFAYRVSDWLSVGAGPILTYGRMSYKLKVPLPTGREVTAKLDKLDDFAVGFGGALWSNLGPSCEWASPTSRKPSSICLATSSFHETGRRTSISIYPSPSPCAGACTGT